MTTLSFAIKTEQNVGFHVNELFPAYENLAHPSFQLLRERYGLDKVVAGIDGEFDRILALRAWIRSQIRIEDANPTEVKYQYAFDILDASLAGGGFHCAHFSIVQSAILNAYGYVCRRLGAGDGRLERGKYHGVNEVWVNEFAQWVLIDAKYDLHFELDGRPLSALQMRDEVIRNGARDVKRVYGPKREALIKDFPEATETYRWVNWEVDTNRFSNFPSHGSSASVLLDDEFSTQHVWYRDGHPNWAYAANYFIHTTHRTWIEWTPNVIKSRVKIANDRLSIVLISCTPNLKSYQMKMNSGNWTDCADIIEVSIPQEGLNLVFRTCNTARVYGPEHRVSIEG